MAANGAFEGYEVEDVQKHAEESVKPEFLDTLVHLSILDEGPRIARDFLAKHGIILVIVPHLKQTYLDGPAFITQNGRPIVGLTLRHDRIDNFDLDVCERVSRLAVLRYATEHSLHPAIAFGSSMISPHDYEKASKFKIQLEICQSLQ